MTTVPPVPARLAHRPTVGGLVVPWISVTHSTGHVLGAVHGKRRDLCLRDILCQTCGQELLHRAVLFVRQADIRAGYTAEPAMHPECAAYSAKACPMLTGAMPHYRSHPVRIPGGCPDPGCECEGWITAEDAHTRAGAPADPWEAWWIDPRTWPAAVDLTGRLLGLALNQHTPIKIRPLEATCA